MRQLPGVPAGQALVLLRHVQRPVGGREQLVDGQGIQGFIAAALGVPQVRGAQGIRHLQQRMVRVDDRFFFVVRRDS